MDDRADFQPKGGEPSAVINENPEAKVPARPLETAAAGTLERFDRPVSGQGIGETGPGAAHTAMAVTAVRRPTRILVISDLPIITIVRACCARR